MENEVQLTKKYGADCSHLHSCFYGSGSSSDPSKVVESIAHKNNKELKLICHTYCVLYKHDLMKLLSQKNNLFARVVYLHLHEPHGRDAEFIRGALFGRNLDLDMLTEIICTRSSPELRVVKETYHLHFKSDLKEDVTCKISGKLKEILLAVLASCRYSSATANTSMAMCDAKTLYEAVQSGRYVDQRSIISVLSQRSSAQMRAVLASYKQLYGHEFMKFLKKDNCGDFGKQLRVVVRCVQSPEKHFAKQLRRALKTGNARETLIRTVVAHAEIDIRKINAAFTAKTGWSLESLIRNEFNNGSSCSADACHGFVGDVLIKILNNS